MPSRSHPIRQSEFSLSDMDQSDSGIFDDSVNSLDSSDEILYLSCESEFPLPSDDNKWRPSFSSTPKMKANVPESSRKSDVQQDSSKPNTGDSLSTKSTQQTEICTKAQMYPFGSIVWGKFWKTHWFPAIVIDGSQAGRKPARMGFFWVMWFGDYKISELRLAMVEPFYRQFQEKCGSKLKPLTEKAVVEAIQACAERVDVEFPTYNSILRWRFSTTFQDYIDQGMNDGIDPFALPEGFSLPRLVIMHLRQIAAAKVNSHSEIDGDDEDSGILTDSCTQKPSDHGTMAGTDETGAGNQKVFCLPCGKYKESIVDHHPLFEGNICAKCKDSLRESLFALDEDGCCLFCNICGEGGALLLCDRLDCGRSFCMECVTKYISRDAIKQLKAQSPWLCFLCTPYSSATHGYILPRVQWRRDLLTFYNPVQRHMEPYLTSFRGEKRKLRVLSLFDGIGTVKLALDQLGLDIEVYYTCETSIEAEVVTSFNHGFSITQLGDAYKLDRKTLQDICPLDLVVGGPPAHDFDVTNREFEGFNDTGMLTLKFLMILREVELLSGADNPVFWLLETTACMKSEFYTTLTLLLEGEPCMWDAQNFAAHLRPRLYWGNLPGLYSAVDYCTKHDGSEFTLQSVLGQGLNRQAMVSKLRAPSLARKSDNQFTGEDSDSKTCMSHSLPIVMDDKPDRVWINEVERVIGFPEHYTDVSYLNVDQRQKLMATASSVPVLKHLLSPLTSMFAMKQ